MDDTEIRLTREAYDLANTLLARGAFRRPIVWPVVNRKPLPELIKKNAARVHDATPESAEKVEMLVTEIDFTVV